MNNVLTIVLMILAAMTGAVFHEAGHALTAFLFGDQTAVKAGRLTLNPLKHIDPVTTILLPIIFIFARIPPLILFKPIPVSFNELKNKRLGMALISVAGPLSNILVAVFFAFVSRLIGNTKDYFLLIIQSFCFFSVMINIFLAGFNLIPIPPLDGSWILTAILPDSFSVFFQKIRTTFIVIFLFLIFSGIFGRFFSPLFSFLEKTARLMTGI